VASATVLDLEWGVLSEKRAENVIGDGPGGSIKVRTEGDRTRNVQEKLIPVVSST